MRNGSEWLQSSFEAMVSRGICRDDRQIVLPVMQGSAL